MTRSPVEQRGHCLIFAWGPPFGLLPRLQIGRRYFDGSISLTWLWFGLYYVRRSVGSLLAYSELYRRQHTDGDAAP